MTVQSIADCDIEYLNEFTRSLPIKYKDIMIPDVQKRAIYADFELNPHEFEILRGDRVLLTAMARYTKKKLTNSALNILHRR